MVRAQAPLRSFHSYVLKSESIIMRSAVLPALFATLLASVPFTQRTNASSVAELNRLEQSWRIFKGAGDKA